MEVVQEDKWLLKVLHEHFDGRGVAVDDIDVEPFVVEGSIISTIYTARVTEVRPGRRHTLFCKLVDKEKLESDNLPMVMHYLNENFFFAELLPFLLGGEGEKDIAGLFPRFHFAHRDDVQCLITIDDLTSQGYTSRKYLDFEHATLALQALGKFHAMSYVAKKRHPAQFHSLVSKIHYPRKRDSFKRIFDVLNHFFLQYTISLYREARPVEHVKYSQQLEEIVNDAQELYGKVYEGLEPMAVLCHGDFKGDNMLFRYSEDGRPLDIKLIDFQLLSYSSPAIDVFLLLFLSTTPDIWETHWDNLFISYRDTLLSTVSRTLQCSVESLQEELGHDAFKRDFKSYCHHGFYVTNFFLPVRNIEPEQFKRIMDVIRAEDMTQENTNDLLEEINKGFSQNFKHNLTAMLEFVLKLKHS